MKGAKKHSQKRDAVYACIYSTKSHPSAEWIYGRLKDDIPDLSLATVYRNLALFKEEGRIVSVATVNGLERYDANTAPHVHFICEDCGKIMDVEELRVPFSLMERAETLTGAQITGCSLSFTGRCKECGRTPEIETNILIEGDSI